MAKKENGFCAYPSRPEPKPKFRINRLPHANPGPTNIEKIDPIEIRSYVRPKLVYLNRASGELGQVSAGEKEGDGSIGGDPPDSGHIEDNRSSST
ncbi:MAG TPA: hypothetical protein VNL16_16260 [Chloroflexota bacterium]|nr:hypothetical protein [Chloroflexota bacterium]